MIITSTDNNSVPSNESVISSNINTGLSIIVHQTLTKLLQIKQEDYQNILRIVLKLLQGIHQLGFDLPKFEEVVLHILQKRKKKLS